MTDLRAEDGDGGVRALERILLSLSRDTPQNTRVKAYIALQDALNAADIEKIILRICEDSHLFCRCILRDMVSSSEDIASQTLRVLGALLHRTTFVGKTPDDEACKFLLSLLALITTSSSKVVISLGLWCLAVQELKISLLARHLNMIVAAIMHGVDNPLGSMAITFEAFQALIHASMQLPVEMRNLSSIWAPPVCHKLLNSNTKLVELADMCLSGTQAVLMPPLPRLSEVLAADIQQRLLTKIEAMMKLEGRSATTAVQAWAWLVKLLGAKSSDKSVINLMLHLLERSFVSPCVQVRRASQVAWVSLIDAFVHSTGDTGVDESSEPVPAVPLSHKRLQLLLTPLKATMTWEKDISVQRDCCRTWIYLLCKLGKSVNEKSVFDAAVVPMLELVFTLGPCRRDESVWQACVDILKVLVSSKGFCDAGVVSQTVEFEGANLSPRTPTGITYTGVFCGSHHKNIKWSSWRLDRLESLLKFVRLLWMYGVDEGKSDSEPKNYAIRSLMAAFECWRLLVQGVELEERDAVRPSSQHVAAVHMLLEFFSELCKGVPSKIILSATWGLADVLVHVLPPVVMASSFYKMRLQLPELSIHTVVNARDNAHEGNFPIPEMVTPIVYMSAAWFKLVFETSSSDEEIWSQPLETLVTSGRSGLDVMGSFHGFACIVNYLGKRAWIRVEESPTLKRASTANGSKMSTSYNWHFLVALWMNVAQQLKGFVEKSNDVPPVGHSVRDSGYQVVSGVLLFPIKHFLMLSLNECEESATKLWRENLPRSYARRRFGICESELKSIEGPWFELYFAASRVSALKNTHINSFTGGLFSKVLKVMKIYFPEEDQQLTAKINEQQVGRTKLSDHCLRFLGGIVAHVLKQTEIPNPAMLAISRKRRKTGYGASSVRIQCAAGMDLEDASNLKDILTVSSRLLILSYEKHNAENGHFSTHEVVASILESLANLAQHISSQNDAVLILQALVQPMSQWFTIQLDSESLVAGNCADSQKSVPGFLMEGLARAWDALLACLQTCRPCLVFDSDLLLVQAPSLAPAFLYHYDAISNRTLAFWEATYGVKAAYLKYPPALFDVFNKLKQEVTVSLPGWNAAAETAKAKLPGNNSNTSRPLGKIMRQAELRIQSMINSVDSKRGARKEERISCAGALREELKPIFGTTKRLNVKESGRLLVRTRLEVLPKDVGKVQEAEASLCAEAAVSDAKPDLSNGFLSTPEGNAFIDALMDTNFDSSQEPYKTSKSARSDHVASTSDEDIRLNPSKETNIVIDIQSIVFSGTTKIENLPPTEASVHGVAKLETVVAEEPRPREKCVPASVSVTSLGKDAASLVTPVATKDSPSDSPTKQVPELTLENVDAEIVQAPVPTCRTTRQGGKGSQAGTKFPRRRKKLKFQDDSQDVEYVVIPQVSKKKAGPHVNRPKEVRSSQRSGRVVKTYTSVDFSQSMGNDLVDSQAVDASIDFTCKKNIPSISLKVQDSRNATEAGSDDPVDKIGSVAQDPTKTVSNVGGENVRTLSLDQVDYPRLKCQLTSLWEDDPSLTFQQASLQEKYECLPALIRKRLHSHLYDLNKKAKANNMRTLPLDQVDYPRLKCRLTSLWEGDASLTFRQASLQENYECLPALIRKRLRSHLYDLKRKAKARIGGENMQTPSLDEVDYPRLKCRLTSLWEGDTSLTFKQASLQEKYKCLPALIRKRLRSHLYDLKRKAKARIGGENMQTPSLDEVDYPRLKCRLTSLWEGDPSLTFKQASLQEKYDCLPALIRKRLHSHLFRLKIEAKARDMKDAPESTTVTKNQDGARVSKPAHLREIADTGESSDGVEETSEEYKPRTRPLRRKTDFHGLCRRSVSLPPVSLRSGGKLRGGKNWRINSEVGRACTLITARLGNKKIAAKRQRIFRNVAAKIKEKMPAVVVGEDVADSRNQPECLYKLRGRRMGCSKQVASRSAESLRLKECTSELPKSSVITTEAVQPITIVEQSQMQENSPFRVRKLNRGLLATAYGLSKIAEVECHGSARTRKYVIQECIRANHNPRKGKLPKRTPDENSPGVSNPSLTLSTGVSSETIARQESPELSLVPSSDFRERDMNPSSGSPLLVCILTEGLQVQPSGENQGSYGFFSGSERSKSFDTADPNRGKRLSDLKDMVDYLTPTVTHPVGLETPEEPAAGGLHSGSLGELETKPDRDVAPGSASGSGYKDVTSEVQSMLERRDIRLSQVLTIILQSSKCENLDMAEVAKVEGLLNQLRHALESRTNSLKSSMFVTPPTRM